MTCPDCPCADVCLRWPVFCDWAADGDEIQRRHICARSAMGEATAAGPPPETAEPHRPDVAEAMRLLEAVRRCPFMSRDTACGCTGNRCGLRPPGRQVLSVQECFSCIQRYG